MTRADSRTVTVLCLSALAGASGCASGPASALRFHNRDPITMAGDRRPIPRPESYEPGEYTQEMEVISRTEAMHALSLPGPILAQNVNALDEVPDSSWFENRIGVRAINAEKIRRGPGAGGPDRSAPLRIRERKPKGTVPGFIVEDARGDRYILKLEPETESGAEIVVQRLLWAAGYHVPENQIVYFERGDLVLDEGATKEVDGIELPLGERDVDTVLARAQRVPGRGLRALASKYLPGKPIGGFAHTGVRPDDPNDRVPHEHRREVRAQRVFFAWLGHTDVKLANTLDMWIETPKGSGLGHVRHNLVDFGKALGVWGLHPEHEIDGYAPHFDWSYTVGSLFSVGLWRRPWEGVEPPGIPGVGRYDAAHFDPERYSPANPYAPFFYTDRFDAFWAARIIGRVSREHVTAAVDAADYSDPRARAYLIDTILARQLATLRYGLSDVNPLEGFAVEPAVDGLRLCAVDLWLAHGLGPAAETRYRVTAYDYGGAALGPPRSVRGARHGRLCISGLPSGRAHARYTMIVYETARGGRDLPPTVVHLASHPKTGRVRVIGLDRH